MKKNTVSIWQVVLFIKNRYNTLTQKAKRKQREMNHPHQFFMELIYSEKSNKILSLFSTTGKQKVDPFDCLNQYCKVKIALIIESIFLSKTIVSLQIKVHEVYVKPLKPRESILSIKGSDDTKSKKVIMKKFKTYTFQMQKKTIKLSLKS